MGGGAAGSGATEVIPEADGATVEAGGGAARTLGGSSSAALTKPS